MLQNVASDQGFQCLQTITYIKQEGPEDPKATHPSFASPLKDHNMKLNTKTQGSMCNNSKQEEFITVVPS